MEMLAFTYESVKYEIILCGVVKSFHNNILE